MLVPEALEDEDLLEMLDVGLLQAIVVDDWKAKAWAQVLPNVKLHEQIVLRPKTRMGWAIRKDSPKLAAELNEFYAWYVTQVGKAGTTLMRDYMARVKAMRNAAAAEDQKRFETLIDFFKKYGGQYKFDPLMLAAQGYQESQLNQNVHSPVGAIGIMQLMPATGNELKVGDIRQAEANIHAGTKYMDVLMTRYFADASFDDQNRALCLRQLQHGTGKRDQDADRSKEARARSGPVVQQRRGRHCGEDRHRDDHLRAEHLQVLCRLSVAG